MRRSLVSVFALLAGLLACSPGDPCEGTDQLSLYCGFSSPEDLEVLPGGRLLVSEYGGVTAEHPGSLKLLHTATGEVETLYPARASDGTPDWGEPSCTEPLGSALASHGTGLVVTEDGGVRLLAVNHAKRESVEIFELRGGIEDPALVWRGCVVAPEPVWLNDVAGLVDGGFVVSHMAPRGSTVADLLKSGDDALAGHVLEWSPAAGWRDIPGTRGALPNGVTLSPDGAVVYVNYYLGREVVAVERGTGKRRWTTRLAAGPDNSSIGPGGDLLVAAHRADLEEVLGCHGPAERYCGVPFSIFSLDPTSGLARVLFEAEGAPFGGATVAVEADGRLYMGSYAGQRIASVARP